MVNTAYVSAVLQAGRDLGITERGIVIGFAAVYVESNWLMYANAKVPDSMNIPHDAVGSDGYSVGLFQQQVVDSGNGWWWGDAATCMDPYKSAQLFFSRLANLDYNNTANSPGSYAQAVQQSAYPDRYDERIADAQALYDQFANDPPQEPAVSELVLDYDHSITPQEQYWDCGPASTQVVLSGRQQVVNESDLIAQIGTNVNGTDDISWVLRALQPRLPDGQYAVRYMPNDPPTQEQKDRLWNDVSNSLNAGYGVVANIVAPPSNYPRGVKGSVSPNYSGGTVFHYVAIMGIDPGARALWVADPGFSPFGYWISFDQMATLIPPKGYAYATAAPAAQQPAPQPTGSGDEFQAWVASASDRQLLEYIINQLGPGDPAWASAGKTLRDKIWGF